MTPDPGLVAAAAAVLPAEADAESVVTAVGEWLAGWAKARYERCVGTDVARLPESELLLLAGRRDEAEDVVAEIRRLCGLPPRS